MDMGMITQFISTLGFPISVCLVCFWYINKRESEHKDEREKLSEAINNNTLVVQALVDRLEGGKKE